MTVEFTAQAEVLIWFRDAEQVSTHLTSVAYSVGIQTMTSLPPTQFRVNEEKLVL